MPWLSYPVPRKTKESRSEKKTAEAKKKAKYQSSSSESDQEVVDPYDEVYFGMESDEDRDRTPRIRAASKLEVKNFSGREMDPDRTRSWLNRLSLKERRDGMSPMEMRDLFSDHIVGGAKSWYRQLPRSIRSSWASVVEEFQIEYCDKSVKPAEQYYTMTRRTDELPIEYLYRLNGAANKARAPFLKSSDQERSHVDRFLRSVEDEEWVRSISLQRIQVVDDLELTLKRLARNTARRHVGPDRETPAKQGSLKTSTAGKTSTPPYFKKPAPEAGSKEKPIAVKNVAWARKIAVVNAPDESDQERSDEDYPSGSDGREGFDNDLRYESRQIAVVQEQSDPTAKWTGKNRPACTVCGSERHDVTGCWKNIQCEHCKRMGHPGDRCRDRCKGCGKVHDIGECPLESIYNRLTARHAASCRLKSKKL